MKRVSSVIFSLIMVSALSVCMFGCQSEKKYYLEHSEIISLQEAYDRGLMSEDDIMHAIYFFQGVVRKDPTHMELDSSKWEKVDFTPTKPKPVLDSETENKIKKAYYYHDRYDYFKDKKEKHNQDNVKIFNFLGKYNDCLVALVDVDFISHGDYVFPKWAGDIVWQQDLPMIAVFVFND